MRMSSTVRRRLLILMVISILTVAGIAIKYLQVPEALGIGVNEVSLQMPETGGLHKSSVVTWQGVTVGKVTEVQVAETGAVTAHLQLDDKYQIPSDVQAIVHEGSPVGEQFVNLSKGNSQLKLTDGSVIKASQLRIPTSTTKLLNGVNNLLTSLPKSEMTSLLKELYLATNGVSNDLGAILDDSIELEKAAEKAKPDTIRLLRRMTKVLSEQARSGKYLKSAAKNMKEFTASFANDEKSFRELLRVSKPLTKQVNQVSKELRSDLPYILADLASVGEVTKIYRNNLEHVLIVLPAFETTMGNLLGERPPGDPMEYLKLHFKLSVHDPPPCTTGYPDANNKRDPNDLSPAELAPTSYCKVSTSDPRAVRGVRNMPCPNNGGRGATPDLCGVFLPEYNIDGTLANSGRSGFYGRIGNKISKQKLTDQAAKQRGRTAPGKAVQSPLDTGFANWFLQPWQRLGLL